MKRSQTLQIAENVINFKKKHREFLSFMAIAMAKVHKLSHSSIARCVMREFTVNNFEKRKTNLGSVGKRIKSHTGDNQEYISSL